MFRGLSIGVVVPAYNEERDIAHTLESMPDYCDIVYVVDDDSTDRTHMEISPFLSERIKYVKHAENKGVGAAIVTGYKMAIQDDVDIVTVIAGDNQMDPQFLPSLLAPLADGVADYAKGNRLRMSPLREGMRPFRLCGNLVLSLMTNISSGYWHISDTQNGYTAITKLALKGIDLDSVFSYYGYCNDILIRLNAAGFRVVDVPMPARYGSEKSKIKYGEYALKVGPMIARGLLWRLRAKYFRRNRKERL